MPVQVLHTLMDFYDRLDRGRYSELYDTVLESNWQVLPDGSCAYAGLLPREEFVAELGKEFDANGAGIMIMSYRMVSASLVSDADPLGSARPELTMLAHLPANMRLKAAYQVLVEGDLGPACLPKSWSKQLYVAEFAPDDWRLLLAAPSDPGATRKARWFGQETGSCGSMRGAGPG